MTPGDLLQNLQAMHQRADDPTPALKAIGDLMMRSVELNFRAEGRPTRWQEVTKATRKLKGLRGKSKILTWSGNLARSITAAVKGRKVVLGVPEGIKYARIHQKGGVIDREGRSGSVRLRTDARGNLLRQGQGRLGNLAVFARGDHKRAVERAFTHGAYQIPMPARPYLLFQPGEAQTYAQVVEAYILTGQIREVTA